MKKTKYILTSAATSAVGLTSMFFVSCEDTNSEEYIYKTHKVEIELLLEKCSQTLNQMNGTLISAPADYPDLKNQYNDFNEKFTNAKESKKISLDYYRSLVEFDKALVKKLNSNIESKLNELKNQIKEIQKEKDELSSSAQKEAAEKDKLIQNLQNELNKFESELNNIKNSWVKRNYSAKNTLLDLTKLTIETFNVLEKRPELKSFYDEYKEFFNNETAKYNEILEEEDNYSSLRNFTYRIIQATLRLSLINDTAARTLNLSNNIEQMNFILDPQTAKNDAFSSLFDWRISDLDKLLSHLSSETLEIEDGKKEEVIETVKTMKQRYLEKKSQAKTAYEQVVYFGYLEQAYWSVLIKDGTIDEYIPQLKAGFTVSEIFNNGKITDENVIKKINDFTEKTRDRINEIVKKYWADLRSIYNAKTYNSLYKNAYDYKYILYDQSVKNVNEIMGKLFENSLIDADLQEKLNKEFFNEQIKTINEQSSKILRNESGSYKGLFADLIRNLDLNSPFYPSLIQKFSLFDNSTNISKAFNSRTDTVQDAYNRYLGLKMELIKFQTTLKVLGIWDTLGINLSANTEMRELMHLDDEHNKYIEIFNTTREEAERLEELRKQTTKAQIQKIQELKDLVYQAFEDSYSAWDLEDFTTKKETIVSLLKQSKDGLNENYGEGKLLTQTSDLDYLVQYFDEKFEEINSIVALNDDEASSKFREIKDLVSSINSEFANVLDLIEGGEEKASPIEIETKKKTRFENWMNQVANIKSNAIGIDEQKTAIKSIWSQLNMIESDIYDYYDGFNDEIFSNAATAKSEIRKIRTEILNNNELSEDEVNSKLIQVNAQIDVIVNDIKDLIKASEEKIKKYEHDAEIGQPGYEYKIKALNAQEINKIVSGQEVYVLLRNFFQDQENYIKFRNSFLDKDEKKQVDHDAYLVTTKVTSDYIDTQKFKSLTEIDITSIFFSDERENDDNVSNIKAQFKADLMSKEMNYYKALNKLIFADNNSNIEEIKQEVTQTRNEYYSKLYESGVIIENNSTTKFRTDDLGANPSIDKFVDLVTEYAQLIASQKVLAEIQDLNK